MNAYSDYLYHEGVKGMHWGVRRYQNADGTLTALGRIHYGVKDFYNGPKMDHVRSSITRGWYTANDPEFLGRKMSEVQKTVGRAAELTKRRDFWNHDVNDIIPFIKNWMNPEQYNVIDVTGSTSADTKGDTTSATSIDWSGAKVGGYANKVINVTNPGRTYIDPDQYDFGNMLINVYESYQDARNVKMADLTERTAIRKIIDETKETDKRGVTTAKEVVTVKQPFETTIRGISRDPSLINAGGWQFKDHTVVLDVDDTLERRYGDKIRKKASEIYSKVVSDEEAANNKALIWNAQQAFLNGQLTPAQTGAIVAQLADRTTSLDDAYNEVKARKIYELDEYEQEASRRDDKISTIEKEMAKFERDLFNVLMLD